MNSLRELLGLRGRLATSDATLMMLSIIGPVLLGLALDRTDDIPLVVFGAFQTGLVSLNGLYRQRSRAKLTLIAVMIGELVLVNGIGDNRLLMILSTFVVMLLVGRTAALGTAATVVGLGSAIAFIILQALYSNIAWGPDLAYACLLVGLGGLWTLTINFVSWVTMTHSPLARAVGDTFAALAQTVRAGRDKNPKDPDWVGAVLSSFESVGGTLMLARSLWSGVSKGESVQSSARILELLALIESSDKIASEIELSVEHISHFWAQPGMETLHDPLIRAWTCLEAALDSIPKALETPHRDPNPESNALRAKVEEFCQRREELARQKMEAGESQAIALLLSSRSVVESLKRTAEELERSMALAIHLRPQAFAERFQKFSSLRSVGPSFSLKDWSLLDRHAWRYAAVVTLGSQLGTLPIFSHGYWIPLHIAIVLKPDFGGTAQQSLDRTMGTLWGSLLGMALVALISAPQILVCLLLLLLFGGIAVRPVKPSFFVALLTPAVILLIQLAEQGGWVVGLARLLSSLVGVGLAMLGVAFLFPISERTGIQGLLSKTLSSHAKLFAEVVGGYAESTDIKTKGSGILTRWRYQAAADNANLSMAIDRLLAQPGRRPGDEQNLPILMSRLRRFSTSVNGLSSYRLEFGSRYQNPQFSDLCAAVFAWLDDLIEALEQGRPPRECPRLEELLSQIRGMVMKLQNERTDEYRQNPARDTDLALAVREQTPVLTQLERISDEMNRLRESVSLWVSGVHPN